MKKVIKILVIILIALGLFYYIFTDHSSKGDVIKGDSDLISTYISEKYGFAVDFPSSFHIYEEFESDVPIINIYQKKPGSLPPFNHFSPNPSLSIYPQGLPMEGVIGEFKDITLDLNINVDQANEYLLDSGETWAYYINPKDTNNEWADWGYIWLRVPVSKYEERCFRNDTEITVYECDIFAGDEIRRFGNASDSREYTDIVESFRLID